MTGTATISTHPVLLVVARRLLLAIPLLLIVSVLSFVLVSVTPGSAVDAILGVNATQQQRDALTEQLGLDLPLPEQYWRWLHNAVRGDLGDSILNGQPIARLIELRLPITLSLIGGALVVILVAGTGLGTLSALRGGALGRMIDVLALLGYALPAFWLGTELVAIFSVSLRLLPATGYVPIAQSPADWARSLVLPVAALSLEGIGSTAKLTREGMLDVLGSEHIRMARANGLSPRSIVFRHALRHTAMRVLTLTGLQVIGLLGGTVFVESVFALPGLGSLMVNSATRHDLPAVQGVALCFTLVVVLVSLAVDLAYTALNPKVTVR
ncbi:ABC transporter permease [Dactylosporangium sp. CA-092794]|uniref:ABC transporter permease n=1 Tax=Dactylosporangium sp. CA-092794 TaxID=3239929 RepID=UPI003D8C4B7C